jgi:hypothetical protein
MFNRESLHKLVDTLPDDAVETAGRVLTTYQSWPPQPPIEVEKLRQRVDERFRKRTEEHAGPARQGSIGSYFTGGSFKPDGDGAASMSTSEGQSHVIYKIQVFRGQRLKIEERLRLADDEKSLTYTETIKGPDGKESRHEATFEVS